MQDWFKDWFGSELYLSVYQHRNDEDARRLCDLIINKTNLNESSKILDGACGAGRHAIYLKKKGFDVYAFDLSKTLLNIASSKAKEENEKINFICADLRYSAFKGGFDLIANLFTSFGYFDSIEDNFIFINSAYEMLNSRGYYVLDYFNNKNVIKNLIPESVKHVNGAEIRERRRIDNGRVIKEITIKQKEEKTFYESVALYSKEEIACELLKIGFKNIDYYGDYYGSEFQEEISPRLILIAQK